MHVLEKMCPPTSDGTSVLSKKNKRIRDVSVYAYNLCLSFLIIALPLHVQKKCVKFSL